MSLCPSAARHCLLLVPAALRAADATPAPDYKAKVTAIFDQAVACKITGYWSRGGGDPVLDFTTPDAAALKLLRQYFLHENPRYLGTGKSSMLGVGHIQHFHFTWLNKAGKKIARASLEQTDLLLFEDTDELFCTTPREFPPGQGNATLQSCVVYLVLDKYKNAPKAPAHP